MSKEQILALLREQPEQSISGQAMSRTLGISRAAVWKAIQALRDEGYVITSAPNRGYRLESGPDRIREGELSGHLENCVIGSQLLCLDTIDSTNTECKRRAMSGGPHGLAVLSEEQTGGREKPSVLCDTMEAVLAAVYLDGGMEAARGVVERCWPKEDEVERPLQDAKGALQEALQKDGGESPTYEITGQSGPPHAPVFWAAVYRGGECLAEGEGKSKKAAEQAAALKALKKLG
jgi:biotin operon repressor BirA-like protein